MFLPSSSPTPPIPSSSPTQLINSFCPTSLPKNFHIHTNTQKIKIGIDSSSLKNPKKLTTKETFEIDCENKNKK